MSRTEDICAQLTRYGGKVCHPAIEDLLDIISDLNDDMVHLRSAEIVKEDLDKLEARLVTARVEILEWLK